MRITTTSQPTAPESTPRWSSVLRRAFSRVTTLLVLSAPLASAGEPDPVEIPPQGSLWNWFVGGSGGYLFDNEAEFGALQVGVDLPFEFAGFQQSVYLEVGRFKVDRNFGPSILNQQVEIDVIPVSLNWKLEHSITHAMGIYLGAGVGLAFMDRETIVSEPTGVRWWRMVEDTDKHVVLFGQLFGGVTAHVSEHLELFAGARAVFMGDDVKVNTFFGGDASLHLSETDVLIEAGARITF